MDIADKAADLEARHRDAALAAWREKARDPAGPRLENGRRLCLGCGEPLSPRRLRALPGAVRCVECQADEERRHGR